MKHASGLKVPVGIAGKSIHIFFEGQSGCWIISPEEKTDKLIPREEWTSTEFKGFWQDFPTSSLRLFLKERGCVVPRISWFSGMQYNDHGYFSIDLEWPQRVRWWQKKATLEDLLMFVSKLDVV